MSHAGGGHQFREYDRYNYTLATGFGSSHRKRHFPMGHHIQAFIGREEVLQEIAQHYQNAFDAIGLGKHRDNER
jgi:hypothetical protein